MPFVSLALLRMCVYMWLYATMKQNEVLTHWLRNESVQMSGPKAQQRQQRRTNGTPPHFRKREKWRMDGRNQQQQLPAGTRWPVRRCGMPVACSSNVARRASLEAADQNKRVESVSPAVSIYRRLGQVLALKNGTLAFCTCTSCAAQSLSAE